jgi:hypothetical protein
MKIALIGPGILPIPPIGWGAVEILIWDYYQVLKQMGHVVEIFNPIRSHNSDQSNPYTPYCKSLIQSINNGNFDFVHLHYDCLHHILPFINANKKGITSWYPYIDQFEKHKSDGYDNIFNGICQNDNVIIFTASQKDYDVYYKFCKSQKNIYILLGGIPTYYTCLNNEPKFLNKSVYLGKIEYRKCQEKYCSIPNIDFYGPCTNQNFSSLECYKGELKRDSLYQTLSEYGNMVLLSLGENGTPYVIKEALMVGLPIVINEYSSNDLDTDLPFIDVIPKNKLDDLEYINKIIQENRLKINYRKEIIDYAHKTFSLETIIDGYINYISSN